MLWLNKVNRFVGLFCAILEPGLFVYLSFEKIIQIDTNAFGGNYGTGVMQG